jgi:menaquinone-dependent protoporphyrinogen IX oxidase
MKGIIIYKGKYGATAQYAGWLGEELNIPAITAENIEGSDLAPCDFIILGTSVYIGKLQISKWLRHNQEKIKDKKIYFFLVSGTPPDQKEKLETYLQAGLPPAIRDRATVYYLHGKLDIAKLSWKDRFLLKMGARLAKDPEEKRSMLTDYNDVKKENIAGLVAKIKESYAAVKPA